MSDERHLVLVGPMGSGKSTVGERCARRLERPLVDTDEIVEAQSASTIAEIFRDLGERGFRELERRAVADACASPTPAVIACGGGAVLDESNREELRDRGFVVWLDTPAEVAAERVGEGSGRPLLDGAAPGERLAVLAEARARAYRDAAHAVVETAGRSIEAVADAVMDAFAARRETRA